MLHTSQHINAARRSFVSGRVEFTFDLLMRIPTLSTLPFPLKYSVPSASSANGHSRKEKASLTPTRIFIIITFSSKMIQDLEKRERERWREMTITLYHQIGHLRPCTTTMVAIH